jgi:hypothetical protein
MVTDGVREGRGVLVGLGVGVMVGVGMMVGGAGVWVGRAVVEVIVGAVGELLAGGAKSGIDAIKASTWAHPVARIASKRKGRARLVIILRCFIRLSGTYSARSS